MSPKKDPLRVYKSKRNLSHTPEPSGSKQIRARSKRRPIFVIQKHIATRLHYDVRLEIDGVMPSWAVPKGPSYDPQEKRLAVRTEDHPMDYATFEGIIPEGHYGAGSVMVWDFGEYEHITKEKGARISASQALENGKIEVFFYGQKMYGAFVLVRTSPQKNWLLIKMQDEYVSKKKNPIRTQHRSVLTGRTTQQIWRDYLACDVAAEE